MRELRSVGQRNGNRPVGEYVPYKDQLDYIADLILELKQMARNQRLITLTGLLDLAYAECLSDRRKLDRAL